MAKNSLINTVIRNSSIKRNNFKTLIHCQSAYDLEERLSKARFVSLNKTHPPLNNFIVPLFSHLKDEKVFDKRYSLSKIHHRKSVKSMTPMYSKFNGLL